MNNILHNVNIESQSVITSPDNLSKKLPLSDAAESNILLARNRVNDIIDKKDKRLIVIVGPCSIHDIKSAKEYAHKLKSLQEELKDSLYLVMRVYFEKPRTTVGWKGLISDPDMDNSLNVDKGLFVARSLLVWLAKLGVPAATEALNPITPQYLADLVSWCAIGARTTESQTHREMSSGLSMAVGFKNGTDGNLNVAINAIQACSSPQSFLGINGAGQISTFKALGNKRAHIILRGGKDTNYHSDNISSCESMLRNSNIPESIVVDCSHGNSSKDYTKQGVVAEDIGRQISSGNKSIVGVMLESHLFSGNQPISKDMQYGVSVTDGCIDWNETKSILRKLSKQVSP